MTLLNLKQPSDNGYYRLDARRSGHIENIKERQSIDNDILTLTYEIENSKHIFTYDLSSYKKTRKQVIIDYKLEAKHKIAYMLYGKEFIETSYKLMDFLTTWYPNADMDMVKSRNFDIKRETLKLKVMFDAILGKIRLPIRIKDEDIQNNS